MEKDEANKILREMYPDEDLSYIGILEKPNTNEEGRSQVSWQGYSTGIKYRDNDNPNLDTYLLAFDSTEYQLYLRVKKLEGYVQHKSHCGFWKPGHAKHCTCGLTELTK